MKRWMFLIINLLIIGCFQQIVFTKGLGSLPKKVLVVVGDNLNVRSNPSLISDILVKLKITTEVELLKRSGKKEKVGDKEGEWVLINTNILKKNSNSETIKGWVFNYFLAEFKSFRKVKYFKDCTIEGWIGDYLLSYDFKNNGTYERKKYDYENDKIISGIKGSIYKFRDVVIALDDIDNSRAVFYLTKEGVLCTKDYDLDGNQICAKCR